MNAGVDDPVVSEPVSLRLQRVGVRRERNGGEVRVCEENET